MSPHALFNHSSTINVRRPCVDGVWSQVDYSGCTLTTGDMDPFLILWFRTDFTEGPAPTVEQVIAQQSAMEAQVKCDYSDMSVTIVI